MKKWLKISLSSLLIVILMFSIAACNTTDNTDSEKVEKVRLVEVTRSIFYAPEYVAIAKGFFEEEGLDVELSTAFGGDKTMTALLSGGADIALVGSETSIYVYAQGSNDPVINFAHAKLTLIQDKCYL
jgi:NitT/TauT family transport system substrate-binding protein